MPKYNPSEVNLQFNFLKPYTPPAANRLLFTFKTNPYIPPKGDRLGFVFSERYTPPIGNNLGFSFVDEDAETTPIGTDQFVFPEQIVSGVVGDALALRLQQRRVSVIGFDVFGSGNPSIRNDTQFAKPIGFDTLGFSRQTILNKNVHLFVSSIDQSRVATPSIINFHKNINGKGFNAELLGLPVIYNLRKYARPSGIDSVKFGTPFLQGGVRYVRPSGISALAFGTHSVVNTRANQTIILNGIAVPTFPKPNVSPQIITTRGFAGTLWGSAYVRRNPSPNGWLSERFGMAWVSRSPRQYVATVGEVTQFGLTKIFDAKQSIFVTGTNTVISGGVFGDIAIRNINFKVSPAAIEAPQILGWTNVENISRYYALKGFNSAQHGQTAIRNVTPSVKPEGSLTGELGNPFIAGRVRRLNTSGVDQLVIGQATVTKTPQLSPYSIPPVSLSQPTVTLYTRYLAASGRLMTGFGESFVAMAQRKLLVKGLDGLGFGGAVLSHGNRDLLAKGSNHSALGNAHRVWYRVRSITPESIFDDQKQYGHRIGGSQYLTVKGFDATLFGTRIVPESQDVLAANFKSSAMGIAKLHKSREYLSVIGFATSGTQPSDRWGKAKLYNSRQYIIQTYDVDSGLNPPQIQGWMAIVNRNRFMGVIGSHMGLFGRCAIQNKATPILPQGIGVHLLGTAFISHRIRSIRLEGVEPSYISGWSNIHNGAFVIAPKSFESSVFGLSKTTNTRRYFPRIGNFESMVLGEPMVSFKIRHLVFESRYTIGPIYIPIHRVDLYSRYVEPQSNEVTVFGRPALTIHKKIITPRWTVRDLFGDVGLRNVTPEVKTKGRNAEDFGVTTIRTQWRDVKVFGDGTQLFGKNSIDFRDRKLTSHGFNAGAIGHALRVRGTGSPPLSTQYIYLNNVDNRGDDQDDTSLIKDGDGIAPPFLQVALPSIRSNVIVPEGYIAGKFGEANVYSNGILIENGMKLDKECGSPTVQLARRTIDIEGIENTIIVGTPRFSPHTIFAVVEAPLQAKDNHQSRNLHYVNSDSGTRKAGEVFGRTRVWMHNPYLNPKSVAPSNRYGSPRVQLKRRYLDVKGIQAYRFGWHKLGDGTQEAVHRQPLNFSVFGKPTITLVKDKLIQVRLTGLNSMSFGKTSIDFFHRTIRALGLNSQMMGSSRGGTLYMPQSLHVGPRRPTIPVGTLMEKFGVTYIGLRVRDIKLQGFDACLMEYDPRHFEERMRVTRGGGGPQPKPPFIVAPLGFDAIRFNASNVKLGVHVIRPDGNADQYRKGAF